MANGFNPGGTFSLGVMQHAGRVIHFTGQVAWNEKEEIVGRDDVRIQTQQCFRNIATILSAVGGRMEDIVSITTYFRIAPICPSFSRSGTTISTRARRPPARPSWSSRTGF